MPATLVHEDGTAKVNSNSFVQVATFDAYCADRGYNIAAYSSDQKTVALIHAGDYLRNEARYRWRGLRVSDAQRMSWPRSGCVVLFGTGVPLASNIVPTAVQDAQCELAFKALTAVLQPDLERGGGIASVAAGGVSVSFMADAMAETLVQVAQGVLKPYLRRYDVLPAEPFEAVDQRGYADLSDPATGDTDGVTDRPGSDDTADVEV